ncbi:MAG: DUF819 family protein [Bacteroidales bacterium]|nr:DUF819 family protein [Bacteroidales bacterium]
MTGKIVLILFYLLFPVLVLYLGSKSSLIKKIGSIVICYAVGLLMGNIGILPENVAGLQDILTSITIPLAIPLLLFSENIRKWLKMAKKTFFSMLLGLLSVIIMVTLGHLIFRDIIPECWKISGMLIGVYSGGTPNLAAISEMLGVNEELYILTHTSDLVIGAFLLLFLLSFGQRFFLSFMKPYKSVVDEGAADKAEKLVEEFESYDGIFSKSIFYPLLKAFGFSLIIFGIGGGLSFLFSSNYQAVVAILTITTLGILSSLVPRINAIKKTFPAGMYFILVFSLVVASMADLGEMFGNGHSIVFLSIFMFIILAVIGSLLLHAIFSWFFGIDADHFIITSVALSMSPPFVPVIAGALKNKDLVLSGLILGIIGYAIGNYLGVLIAYILH